MIEHEKLLRLFTSLLRQEVVGAKKRGKAKVSEDIAKMNFIMTSFTPGPKQTIELQMIDSKDFAVKIAGEANKFFLASMVSLERAKQIHNHNISWQIVEHYYAAYYSVHYLMRLSGYSVTNIDGAVFKKMIDSRVFPGAPPDIKGGLCSLRFDNSCEKVEIQKKEKGGGSHKDAWEVWSEIVKDLIVLAEGDIAEYAPLLMSLQEHSKFIERSAGYFSPPEIRGEVNYQFKGDSWCFEDKVRDKIDKIRRIINDDNVITVQTKDSVSNLINNNNLIIRLARSVFEYSVESYDKGMCRVIKKQYKDRISTF